MRSGIVPTSNDVTTTVVTSVLVVGGVNDGERAPQYVTTEPVTALPILALDRSKYGLKRPITLFIHCEDDQYIACFPEAEIVTSGETADEALNWMRGAIADTFELLNANRRALGPLPKRQLRALEKYVAKKQTRTA
jgi:predicted RNase H-like HicB family nuclease